MACREREPLPDVLDDAMSEARADHTRLDAEDTALDAGLDADSGSRTDAIDTRADEGPDAMLDAERPRGWVRFVHIAMGLGRVRFVAQSAPPFEIDRVEAVLDEGQTSGYVSALPVPHAVRVYREGDPEDAGTLAAPLVSDVYNNAGCSVALIGTPGRDDAGAPQLLRLSDLPFLPDAGRAFLRAVPGLVGAPPAALVEEDGTVLWPALTYSEYSGLRETAPGLHSLRLEWPEAGLPSMTIDAALEPDIAQSLFFYGTLAPDGDASMRAFVASDMPPRDR